MRHNPTHLAKPPNLPDSGSGSNLGNDPTTIQQELSNEWQAETFDQTRQARQSEIAEDYVELIADLISSKGEARKVDIARCLGVSQATVNNTITRLCRDGLVTSQPYRSIFLTTAGERIAQRSKQRHLVVYTFLQALGVSARQAQIDAEGIEHYVSEETLLAMSRMLDRDDCKMVIDKSS